jgi:hypothetical protein
MSESVPQTDYAEGSSRPFGSMTKIKFAYLVDGARCALSRVHPRRGPTYPAETLLISPSLISNSTWPPTKWRGVDPAEYESQLRAFLREDEQSELARLHSKQTVRKALHLGTMALVSWRYQLHRNEIRPSGVANIRRHFILHLHRVCRSYSEGARPESHVRNGSFASFLRYTDHFRSTAINGHRQTGSVGPVRANSRHALALMFAVMQKPYTASALVREAEH